MGERWEHPRQGWRAGSAVGRLAATGLLIGSIVATVIAPVALGGAIPGGSIAGASEATAPKSLPPLPPVTENCDRGASESLKVADGPTGEAADPRPDDPPYGVSLQVTPNVAGHVVKIAGSDSPNTVRDPNGIALVVLDRSTRRRLVSGTINRASIGRFQCFANYFKTGPFANRTLMIIAGPNGVDAGNVTALSAVATDLGAPPFSAAERTLLGSGQPFTFLGVPGASPGTATVNVARPDDGLAGAVTGVLRYSAPTSLYGYLATDQVPFNTQAQSTATSNVMTVGGQSYSGQLPAGSTAGFQFVVLDPLSLRLVSNVTMPTNGPNAAQFQPAFTAWLTAQAKTVVPSGPAGRRPLFLVQSIGKPKNLTQSWLAAAPVMESLGGTKVAFDELEGASSYSLAANPSNPGSIIESGDVVGQPGPLNGLLGRGLDMTYQPLTAGPAGAVNLDLAQLVEKAPTAYPPFSDADQATVTFIGDHTGVCESTAPACPVRQLYPSDLDSMDWQGSINSLTTLQDTTPPHADFATLKTLFLSEWNQVVGIDNYFTKLKQTALAVGTATPVYNKVADRLQPPSYAPGPSKTAFVLTLLSKIALLGSFAGAKVSPITSGISAVLGVGAFFAGQGGGPLVGVDVRARSDQLVSELNEKMTAAANLMNVEDAIVVSDPAKLATMAQKLPTQGWKITDDQAAKLDGEEAARQWLAQALLPVAYPYLFIINPLPPRGPGSARGLNCTIPPATDHPFALEPDGAELHPIGNWSDTGNPKNEVQFFARSPKGPSPSPPSLLTDFLFGTYTTIDGPLGLNPVQTISSRFWGPVAILLDNYGDSTYPCNFGHG